MKFKRRQWAMPFGRVDVLDPVAGRIREARVSFTEMEALQDDFWSRGREVRLREDRRFRPTPWGRWMLVEQYLVNDLLRDELLREDVEQAELQGLLDDIENRIEAPVAFCPGDPRFVYDDGHVRLSARGRRRSGGSGGRDIWTARGQESVYRRLGRRLETFFGQQGEGPEEEVAEAEASWEARLCLLEYEAGGLHLEAGPLEGLPTFVRNLKIRVGEIERNVLGGNVRARIRSVAVPPSVESYEWVAPDFEEELAPELAQLALSGLAAEVATAFRVDAAGTGRPLESGSLSPGQTYRVLIPPGLAEEAPGEAVPSTAAPDWCLWEVELSTYVPATLRQKIRSLGLSVGRAAVGLKWVASAPVKYRRSANGECYPCFLVGEVPRLRVEGAPARRDGDVRIFLVGQDSLSGKEEAFELPAGESWQVALEGLEPGRYVLSAIPHRKDYKPSTVCFEMVEEVPAPPAAYLQVDFEGEADFASLKIEGRETLEKDLRPGDEAFEVAVEGPPLWPVPARWHGFDDRAWSELALDEQGVLEAPRFVDSLETLVAEHPTGELRIDFGDLGALILQHRRFLSVEREGELIASLYRERGESLEQLADNPELLRSIWFENLVRMLGYRLGELAPSLRESAPADAWAYPLETFERSDGELEKRVVKLLVALPPTDERLTEVDEELQGFIDDTCMQLGVEFAILSDGRRWKLRRRGARLSGRTFDVGALVESGEPEVFEHFLFSFGAPTSL